MTLSELHGYVTSRVPHYQKLKCAKFDRLPIVSKNDLLRNFSDFVSDEFAALRETLSAVVLDHSREEIVSNHQLRPLPGIVIEQTTGTTGVPVRYPKTTEERTALSIGIWRKRRSLDPSVTTRNMRPFVHLPFSLQETISYFSDDPDYVARLYEKLRQDGVSWLHAKPHMLCKHIALLKAAGFTSWKGVLHTCETSGDMLSASDRQTISEFFGCQVADQYGCMESWAIGYDTVGDGLMDIIRENVHVEVIDAEDGSVIEGPGKVGNIVISSLKLRLMPIVRYAIGDRGEWVAKGTRHYLRLHEDRQSNLFLIDGRYVSGGATFRQFMNIVLRRYGYFRTEYIQFVQTSEQEVTVRLAKSGDSKKFFEFLVAFAATLSKAPFVLTLDELSVEQVLQERNKKHYLFLCKIDCGRAPGFSV